MSLNREDWKKVLNQPKNLGLKAGDGTGIGKALDEVDKKKASYVGEKAVGSKKVHESGEALIKALTDLIKKCNDVSAKHKKLFTTACKYLETDVAGDAQRLITTTRREMTEIDNAQNAFKERRQAVIDVCHTAEQEIKHVKDIHGAITRWQKFKTDLGLAIVNYERVGEPGKFKNNLMQVNEINIVETNLKAFEYLRSSCANQARLMGTIA